MKIVRMTFLGFYLNGAAGSGRYDDISIADMKQAIRAGTVFDVLERRLGHDVDLSILDNDDRAELLREWRGLADDVDEDRKLCVERNGLCLLVAYLLEGIQQRAKEVDA